MRPFPHIQKGLDAADNSAEHDIKVRDLARKTDSYSDSSSPFNAGMTVLCSVRSVL